MDELDALATELQRQLPPVPAMMINKQRERLLRDPRARVTAGRSQRNAFYWAIPAVSAGLVLVVGALWLLPLRGAQAPEGAALELSARGSELRHTLADGSIIRLDDGARGRLEDLGRAGVRFELERGRGSFSVTPNRGRVFSVKAGRYEVQVLGTKFSVGYEPAGAIDVAVEHGLVLVREGLESVRLAAGDRLSASRNEQKIERAGERTLASRSALRQSAEPEPSVSPTREAAPAARLPTATSPDWRELYRRRDYTGALAAARLAGLPRLIGELAASELADLADAARLGGDPAAALMALRALERRFPSSPLARNAGFLIGRVLTQSGRTGEAISAFERYLAANPDGVYSLETMGRLMELYPPRGDAARAQAMAVRYLQRAPSGPYQRLARSLATPR